ncbi:hypothetical protein GMOD_00006953 [Pyrenophora seminiperda CCB06]|uniref:Uncharacterized protein n=1 Tax=Pyrenophora seminiperda CCB06 TaxID=1302712 RepID=A0A3M7MC55_9PLEO|nr:hypothetical protein GMOD_00006953 [Pyrenophora seminiperda CCB06]
MPRVIRIKLRPRISKTIDTDEVFIFQKNGIKVAGNDAAACYVDESDAEETSTGDDSSSRAVSPSFNTSWRNTTSALPIVLISYSSADIRDFSNGASAFTFQLTRRNKPDHYAIEYIIFAGRREVRKGNYLIVKNLASIDPYKLATKVYLTLWPWLSDRHEDIDYIFNIANRNRHRTGDRQPCIPTSKLTFLLVWLFKILIVNKYLIVWYRGDSDVNVEIRPPLPYAGIPYPFTSVDAHILKGRLARVSVVARCLLMMLKAVFADHGVFRDAIVRARFRVGSRRGCRPSSEGFNDEKSPLEACFYLNVHEMLVILLSQVPIQHASRLAFHQLPLHVFGALSNTLCQGCVESRTGRAAALEGGGVAHVKEVLFPH